MYAVIRAGGKQYRVSPGDVIDIERQPAESGNLEFTDVLAASAAEGQLARPQGDGARVVGRVLEEGRGDKVLVFHYKRKKQYKKIAGHRQPFSRVRITEIVFDGQSYKAPAEHEHEQKKSRPAKAAHAEKPAAHAEQKHAAEHHAKHAKPHAKKSASKSSGKKKK
jgi:large subunit ribosomal protein L21